MNQILQGWNKVLKDYRHWKMILRYPYCPFNTCVFFGNLGHPPNSLVDYYVAGMKQLDEYEEVMYDNLWELYDGIERRMKESDDLMKKVDEVLDEEL